MYGRKNSAFINFLAIAVGTLAMIKWSTSYGLISDYFTVSGYEIMEYLLIPLVISIMVFIISSDVMPIVAIYLIFFMYIAVSGNFFGQAVYFNLTSFLISTLLVWAFKRFLSF